MPGCESIRAEKQQKRDFFRRARVNGMAEEVSFRSVPRREGFLRRAEGEIVTVHQVLPGGLSDCGA